MKLKFLFVILLCAVFLGRDTDGARILGIFPLPAKSHFVMFKAVMRSLADAGHQVDVVSYFPLEKPHPNYTDIIDLMKLSPQEETELTFDKTQEFSGLSFFNFLKHSALKTCSLLEKPELQKLITDPPNNPPYDLFITEFLLANCYLAFGRHLKVPTVGLTSLPSSVNADVALGNPRNPAIVLEIDDRPDSHMNFWQRFENTIKTFSKGIFFSFCRDAQDDIVKKIFGPGMPDIKHLESEMALNLVISHPILTGVRPMTPAIVEVAGIHVNEDRSTLSADLKKWLDESKNGVVYFSFGSMLKIETFPKDTLAEIYRAFAAVAPLRILLKITNEKELPSGLPENVLTLSWIPQVQVLKHKNIRAFVTHGGLGGVQEALEFAVPMIGVPVFADQLSNLNTCVQLGVAVTLDHKNLTTENLVAAINAVVQNPAFKKRMNAVSRQYLDRPRNAKETAVFWIEYVLKHGANALRSPAVHLTWWQLALLDVYGSILAAVVLILYIIKLLLAVFLRFICSSNKEPTKLKLK